MKTVVPPISTVFHGREVVDVRRERHPPADGQGRTPVPAAEAVHGRSEQEPGGVVHAAHALPAFPDLQVRVLHDLLRLVAVPDHEAAPAEEALVRLLEERLEAGVGLGHLVPFGLGGHPPEWDRHRGP
jgi:hypothetical protein